MKIVVIGGFAPSLINFRGPLLRALREQGHSVTACAPGENPEVQRELAKFGIEYEPLRFERAGMNPMSDAGGVLQLYSVLRKVPPDVVLNYTIKPVIYGSLVARAAGVRSVCSMITGLGYVFTKESVMQRIVRAMYRTALRKNDVVFFQNKDDREEFQRLGIIGSENSGMSDVSASGGSDTRRTKVVVISGSGVDLDYFSASARQNVSATADRPTSKGPASDAPPSSGLACGPVFLLIARLLRDKGILEFAAAAKSLKEKYPRARFQLVGAFDSNPAALSKTEVEAIVATGAVEYLGETADVRPYLAACDVYVLPSYREGTPRTVLEAMATGRAVITTDAPGCRETVRRVEATAAAHEGDSKMRATSADDIVRGDNGFLVPIRDAHGLESAMERFISTPSLIQSMGLQSRAYAEERYDVHKVNAVIMHEIGATTVATGRTTS